MVSNIQFDLTGRVDTLLLLDRQALESIDQHGVVVFVVGLRGGGLVEGRVRRGGLQRDLLADLLIHGAIVGGLEASSWPRWVHARLGQQR